MRTRKQLEQRIAKLEAEVARLSTPHAPLIQHLSVAAPDATLSAEAIDRLRKRIRQADAATLARHS